MGDETSDNQPLASIETLEARKRIVTEITNTYKAERYVYLSVSILSFIFIAILAFSLYRKNAISVEQLVLFLGPTGFLAVAVSRILFMWSNSLKIIFTGRI
jgi:hypothetical protein